MDHIFFLVAMPTETIPVSVLPVMSNSPLAFRGPALSISLIMFLIFCLSCLFASNTSCSCKGKDNSCKLVCTLPRRKVKLVIFTIRDTDTQTIPIEYKNFGQTLPELIGHGNVKKREKWDYTEEYECPPTI